MFKASQNIQFINDIWDKDIIPSLMNYIKIPNKSPHFDPNWRTHGYMDEAVRLIANWCNSQAIENMTLEVIQLEDRTPVIFMDIPGNNDKTILLYGHLDKQPEMTGWDSDLHPWKPVLKGDRLYGRGSADDGYAAYASLAAIKALHAQHIPHARCVILIEACEESGSFDLPYYINALEKKINHPDLIICLDSGCGNYDQLWMTTSLRGLITGTLTIEVLKQGLHSGHASGVVPSCFRIFRQLIDRIEDIKTGDVLVDSLHVNIPEERIEQAQQAADILQHSLVTELSLQSLPMTEAKKLEEVIMRRTWKPALSVIGINGVPQIENAGNVTLPTLSVRLSMRVPPTCDTKKAATELKKILEENPPYGAKVSFNVSDQANGWNAPTQATWLQQSVNKASEEYFGKPAVYMGEGGSIPFMGMLGEKFPEAQFVITGVLGPESNAHGPNEFLHIPTGKKLTACIAQVIADHYVRE